MNSIQSQIDSSLEEMNKRTFESQEEKEEYITEQKHQLIRKIAKLDISENDKNYYIQSIMSYEYDHNEKRKRRDSESHYIGSVDVENGSIPPEVTWHDEEKGILGCKHYMRGAKMMCPECHKFFTCRFCHNDACTHEIDRYAVEYMACMYCFRIQKCARECKYCHKVLGNYYCDICHFWCNDTSLNQFISFDRYSVVLNDHHCPYCKLCRHGRGLGIDSYHCRKCNVCMHMNYHTDHVCIENKLFCDCPICGEFMQTSTRPALFLVCGHGIHEDCLNKYLRTNYVCPVCMKSITDTTLYFQYLDEWVRDNPMPEEYQGWTRTIICNDCEKFSTVPFNFLYHKCPHCNSYNTKVIQTFNVHNKDIDEWCVCFQ